MLRTRLSFNLQPSQHLFQWSTYQLHILYRITSVVLSSDILIAFELFTSKLLSPHIDHIDPERVQPIMDSLPNELLIQIASHFDHEAPSVRKFAHEPSTSLTCSEFVPLQSLSRVSWRWRKIVVSILFRYSRIALDTDSQWVPIDSRLVDSMQGQMATLTTHEFQIYQKMRTKFKSSSDIVYKKQYDHLLTDLAKIQEGDNFLKSVPQILWLPHLPKTFVQFEEFVSQYKLEHHIKSLVVYTNKEYESRYVDTDDDPLFEAVYELWSQIFKFLNPCRLVVAAPPTTLVHLLDAISFDSDAWAFEMKMHYIELLQADPPVSRPWTPPWVGHPPRQCSSDGRCLGLIDRRPWYHFGYNEGSSVSAYSTYEYHLKESPRVLYFTLKKFAKAVPECCNITSFSFTGVFPSATNVTIFLRALSKIQTMKTVSIRFAPGPENNLLGDAGRMGRAQASDLWLEWRESYNLITNYLATNSFEDGTQFRSLDCEKGELVDEVEGFMQSLLEERGIAWRKEAKGCWVRDHTLDEFDDTSDDPSN